MTGRMLPVPGPSREDCTRRSECLGSFCRAYRDEQVGSCPANCRDYEPIPYCARYGLATSERENGWPDEDHNIDGFERRRLLDEEQVAEIRRLCSRGVSRREVATRFGVGKGVVEDVLARVGAYERAR